MINGFEEKTAKLSSYELSLAKMMIRGFESKIGKENAITASEIVKIMTSKGYKINDRRVRKIVHFIVSTGQINRFVATNNGYHIANTDQEVEDHVESLIQRSLSILVRAKVYPCYQKLAMGVEQIKIFNKNI
jgi:hypothetical protein